MFYFLSISGFLHHGAEFCSLALHTGPTVCSAWRGKHVCNIHNYVIGSVKGLQVDQLIQASEYPLNCKNRTIQTKVTAFLKL